MGNDVLDALLAAFPLPTLAIDGSERIVAANAEALTLIGQQALERNYVTMLRQPALLDAIEATLQDGQPRTTSYLGNDGAQDTTFRVRVRAVPGVGRNGAGAAVLVFEDMRARCAAILSPMSATSYARRSRH